MESMIEKAERIAREAHEGQFRWDGVTPYITHPQAVASQFEVGYVPEYQVVAWLHDVLEDSDWTAKALWDAGFPAGVCAAVAALTHMKDEGYDQYIARIADSTYMVKVVKMADLRHNLSTSTDQDAKNKRLVWKLSLMLLERSI